MIRHLLTGVLVVCSVGFGAYAFVVGIQGTGSLQTGTTLTQGQSADGFETSAGGDARGSQQDMQGKRDGSSGADAPASGPSRGASTPPPFLVEVVTADQGLWTEWQSTVGVVHAVDSIDVKSAVSGRIIEIAGSGQRLKKGDVLLRLDNRKERAELDRKAAALALAQSQFDRAEALSRQRITSTAALESAKADVLATQAELDLQQAILDEFTVLAPFDGITGLHNLSAGEWIDASQVLLTFVDADHMQIEFDIPSKFTNSDLTIARVKVHDPKTGFEQSLPVTITSPEIDAETLSVRMRANIPENADEVRPGMTMSVGYQVREIRNAVKVPDLAIVDSAYGAAVFVASEAGEVEQRFVRVAGRQNGIAAISMGISAGETVIVTGQLRLYPGRKVDMKPYETGTGQSADGGRL